MLLVPLEELIKVQYFLSHISTPYRPNSTNFFAHALGGPHKVPWKCCPDSISLRVLTEMPQVLRHDRTPVLSTWHFSLKHIFGKLSHLIRGPLKHLLQCTRPFYSYCLFWNGCCFSWFPVVGDLLMLLARRVVMAELPVEKREAAVVPVLFGFVAIVVPSIGEIMGARGCTTRWWSLYLAAAVQYRAPKSSCDNLHPQ